MSQPGSLAYFKLIGAMFMWGGTWIAGRIVAQEVPAPMLAAAFRVLIAGMALGGFALLTEGALPRPADGREWAVVSGLAITGIFLYAVCFFYGLRYIPAGRGALVVALNPVVVALVAWLIGRSATKTLSPLAATLYASLIGALLLAVMAIVQGDITVADWSWRVWASVFFLAICGTALGFTWFADGVRLMGAARASAFINLVPVFAVLQAAVLLGERLAYAVLAGGALVVAGVWLTTRTPSENPA